MSTVAVAVTKSCLAMLRMDHSLQMVPGNCSDDDDYGIVDDDMLRLRYDMIF